ncbi:MAG: hypothetical protein ACM3UR_02750 [Bacteroidota bacterium]|jgi:glutathione synthase/RimK-type ligase-like ATP-grasp enzyme|nr:hypothetical protein [Ignavibacteria bacterium]MCU7497715.1 hypothetical protein [Ignavibacteria bacterium]MCU7510980.1 hypothetical protein [Ignavibacteria bacterium]MCU7518834.1 hypothetical protein [Ignavibacteria bacterium]MCU7523197.1 hypothetical protein [Ignavibacteria bacterium]
MKIKFAGIRRKTEFSPNHEVNDLAIINCTAENLRKMGADVTLYDEDTIGPDIIKEDIIFSMVQGPKGIQELFRISERGPLIINSPESVYSCYRFNMLRMLSNGGIPTPKSILTSTGISLNGQINEFSSERLWIKRGDVHAVRKEDVISVAADREEITSMLEEFHRRKVDRVILQEHIPGDTVKFYAVRETGFFYWYYLANNFSICFDEKSLRQLSEASAEILGLYVYGGDAIITSDGSIIIIDINDWPSFAPIREEAGYHISNLLLAKGREFVNSRL